MFGSNGKTITLIAATIASGCAVTYQPPAISEANFSIPSPAPKNEVMKQAKSLLLQEGYQIQYADEESGVISTSRKNIRIGPAHADCGSTMGLNYLEDNRTETSSSVSVIITEESVEVRSNIEANYRPGDVSQDITLSCVSKGLIENRILQGIQKASR